MSHILSQEENARYARHLTLPGFGPEGQQKLAESSVLIIGAGGLGSPIALYLAAAGIGHITIADGDNLDISNLQRQVIHRTADIGRPKAISAAEKMRALNPEIEVTPIASFITDGEIDSIISHHDFIIDATDSLDMKFAVDQACLRTNKPYSHGAIFQYEGQTMTVLPTTARFSDLFPDGPTAIERSAPRGPLGVVPGILGTIQATEAIKYLIGIGDLITDRLLRFDVLSMRFTSIRLH